jgi:hypothetical protein
MYARQCKLRRGEEARVSWIPEQFAVNGKYLELRDEDKEWSNGWQVAEVYGRQHFRYVEILSSTYRYTRKVSDI